MKETLLELLKEWAALHPDLAIGANLEEIAGDIAKKPHLIGAVPGMFEIIYPCLAENC